MDGTGLHITSQKLGRTADAWWNNNDIANIHKNMRTSHALLLRFQHDPQYDFRRVSVEYVNRGAPGDRSVVQGDRILKLEQGGMEIESERGVTFIPYHRIRRIIYDGKTMWEKTF